MPRHKSAKNCELKAWLTANIDCKDGRFIQVGNSLLLSHTFQTLNYTERYLYLCMAMESGGRIEFTLPKNSAKKYGIPPATFSRAVNSLIDKGFITVNSGFIVREENIYRFSFTWKNKPP